MTTATEEKINGRTPDEWEALAKTFEAEARLSEAAAQESWERSDTDGFMSQWASGLAAQLRLAKAEWARAHGTCETNILLTVDDKVASTHGKEGEWGWFWVLRDEPTEKYGKRFFSESKSKKGWAAKARLNAQKGFKVARVRVRAFEPKLVGATATSVRPHSQPDWKALKADQFEIVHADWLMELERVYGSEH